MASNKEVVERMIDAIRVQDLDALQEVFAPDVSWWITGTLDVSGETRGRDEVMKFFSYALDVFQDLELTVSSLFAEGDRVAAEWRMVARNAAGELYDGRNAVIVEVRDGLVLRVREYLDTEQVNRVLLGAAVER